MEVRQRHGVIQETPITYGIKAEGLHNLLITAIEEILVQFSRENPIQQTFLLPDFMDNTENIGYWTMSRSLIDDSQMNDFDSFDVQTPCSLVLSPNSCQLAYTTFEETRSIYVTFQPTSSLALVLPKMQAHSLPTFLGFLRKLLSSRTDRVRPIRTNEPPSRDPLDFPATAPSPHSHANPHEKFRPPTIQSSAPASTSFNSYLNRLSTWWPPRTDHASQAIIDVPLA
ncbi:hypothetical protein BDR07DRAFT_1483870 [Suillus spraguei]|nr:hypothetical protein BDR07DRAFT_1483870 [Suillus spraguei]